MGEKGMSILLDSLKKINDKILSIKLYDEEKYDVFAKRAEEIEKRLIEIDDNGAGGLITPPDLIRQLSHLDYEVNYYMQVGKMPNEETGLEFGDGEEVSGEEEFKQTRINTYRQLAKVIGALEIVDIERLKKLKSQWDTDKTKIKYSEVERDAIEKALADAFIDYQVKYCKREGIFPQDRMEDYCTREFYESQLKSRFVSFISSLPKDSYERLDLESYFYNWNLDSIMANENVWKAMAGIESLHIPKDRNIVDDKDVITTTEGGTPNNENRPGPAKTTSALPLDMANQIKGNAVMIVYEKTMPDFSVQRRTAIKYLNPDGSFKTFFNKDKVVEMHFLEGVTKLSFSKNGKSRMGMTHLSEFPNLSVVSLPSTLREIEQGYFLNCDQLNTIHIANGVVYSPNRQLFPSRTVIVEHNDKKTGNIPIEEPTESSALFTREVPLGNNKINRVTIKIPVNHYGEIAKSFTRNPPMGITEARFSKGVKSLYVEYDTQEYESIIVRGGKYSKLQDLRKVILPEGLTSLGVGTFQDCLKLEEIEFSDNMNTLPTHVCDGCIALRKIKLPKGLEKIKGFAFRGCKAIKGLDFPDTLQLIQQNAFEGCEGLQKLDFPEGFRTIGPDAFKNCYNLSRIKFPRDEMGVLYERAFMNCTSIQTLALSRKYKRIESSAFQNCRGLTSVLMARECEDLRRPFIDCSNFRYALIPYSYDDDKIRDVFTNRDNLKFIKCGELPDGVEPESFIEEQIERDRIETENVQRIIDNGKKDKEKDDKSEKIDDNIEK